MRRRAQEAARVTKQAGQQAVEDVRPHLLAALKQVNFELRELIERLERGQGPATSVRIEVSGPESEPGDEEAPAPDAGVA